MLPFEPNPDASPNPHRSAGGGGREAKLARCGADDALLEELEARKHAIAESHRSRRWRSLAGWLVGPLLLGAALAALLLIRRGPDSIFGVVFGAVLALGLVWILVSSLFPGQADRRCSSCGADELQRLDPRTTRGLRCGACGWVDPHSSSFLLAEDDGAEIERIAMRDRSRRRF